MSERSPPVRPNDAEQGFDLREAIAFAWRQWRFIAAITALVLLVGTVVLLRKTPLYTATAQVLLNRPHERAPSGGAVVSDSDLDDAMIEGQMAILRSTVFLRRVVEREHLGAAPLAASTEKPPASGSSSVLSAILSPVLSLIEPSRADEDSNAGRPAPTGPDALRAAQLRAVAALQNSLKVTRISEEGYVIGISVTSPDPVKAARLANAVASAYLVDKLDTRLDAAKRASAWLSDRLVSLRKQLHNSEEAVEEFRAAHGLIGKGGVTLTEEQLSKLNASLIDAKAELAQKRAQVELLDRLEHKGGSLKAMPGIANAGALQTLESEASALSAQKAKLLARYGAAHPLVINVSAQLSDVDRSIAAETQRLAAAIRNDYRLAEARVASLQNSLKQATGQTNLDDATAIRLHELERTAAVNKILFEDFLKQAKITQAQATFKPQDVRILTPAEPPGAPSYPRKERYLAINLFIGLFFGVGGAFAKEKLKSGFTTPKEVEDVLGLPLLTSVSHLYPRDLTLDRTVVPIYDQPSAKPLSRYSEAIRTLRSGIQMTDVDHPPKVIQVTSAVPGEGKTTIALSLAASAALAKLRVAFVDADLRHPTATRVLGLQKEPGLVDVLVGEARLEDMLRLYEKGGYWGMGAGAKTQNPTDLLASERMRAVIAALRGTYDLVVVDTPPAGPVMDPVVVSHLSDKIVLVVKWGATARELVKASVEQLSGHRKIAGIAFNLVNDRLAQKYGKHAYAYYYGNRHYKDYYSE